MRGTSHSPITITTWCFINAAARAVIPATLIRGIPRCARNDKVAAAAQRYFSRFFASSISIFPSGRQFITSAFVSQPLRATPMPKRNSCKRSTRCASGLMTHFTPFSFASGHQRQSRSSRFGAALISIHVPVSAAASMIAGISIA